MCYTIMGSLKTKIDTWRAIVALLLLFFFSSEVSGQVWKKLFPGYTLKTTPYQVVQCYDKGIMVCVGGNNSSNPNYIYGILLKMDVKGNVIDSSYLIKGAAGYVSIGSTMDNGLIIGGATDLLDTSDTQPLLIKLDACGKKQWCAFLPHYYIGSGVDVVLQTSDGGYIVEVDNYGTTFALCRLDSTGKFLWAYTCPATFPNVIMAEKNGNVLIAGSNYLTAFTSKINATGNIIWENNYGIKEHTQANLYSIVKTQDNGYLSIVSQSNPPITNLLMKQDSNGNVLWAKSLDSNLNGGAAYCLALDSLDGNYIALVSQTDPNTWRTWTSLVKFDSTGHVLKTRNYDDSTCVSDYQMIPTYDHKFLICGNYGADINTINGVHLYKVNPDLSPADWDTGHFIYNGLCPNMPKSDTLNLDGYFIVNFDTANERQFADSNINTQDYSTLTNIAPVKNSLLKITISPNPSQNTFNINIQGNNLQQSEVSLTDILGHSIAAFTAGKNEFTINANDYKMRSGVYLLTIHSGNNIFNAKLVVE